MAKMGKEQFEKFLAGEIASSLSYLDSNVAKRREQILKYIQLDMYDLPAMKGHSSVVDATVGNQIGLMMPGLMRIMTSGPLIGEYAARGDKDEELAKLATEYVNHVVLKEDNNGELIIYNWGYDGLSQIIGVVKGYWEEDIEEEDTNFNDLTDDEYLLLFNQVNQDPELSIEAYEEEIDDNGLRFHNVTVRKTKNRSHVALENLPPEEFVVSASARTLEDAVLKSHRTYVRAGDLKDRYPGKKELIDKLPSYEPTHLHQERLIRGQVWDWANSDDTDPEMREIAVHEGIVRCNYDGKGLKHWFFVAAGNNDITEILEIEPYDDQVQFYDFCPQPLPHTVIGRCPGDDLVQVQKAKTAVLRQTMDNLYQANSPQRMVYADGLAKGGLEALINRLPGGIVLAKNALQNGGEPVRELATPFFAQHSFPMLEYFDNEAEKRTGISRAAMGLDPDALNDQTAAATKIAQTAAMGKVEMIAKIWAVGGMRKMFRGVLRILKKYQDFPRRVKLRGQLIEVDPRQWQSFDDWDVTVNTGLGTGSKDRDLSMLGAIMGKMEQMLQQGGPQNGVVTVGQYAHAFKKFIETAGIVQADKFVNDLPIEFTPQPPQPPPDPRLLEVQRKAQKDQVDAKIDMAQVQIKAEELALKRAEILQRSGEQLTAKDISEMRLKYEQMLTDAALKRQQILAEFSLKAEELDRETVLEKYAIDMKAQQGNGRIPN